MLKSRSMRRLILVSLGAMAIIGCRHAAPPSTRTLHVRASADPVFRQRANWRDLVASRIEAASRIFDLECDVRLEMAGVSEWMPDTGATLEERRRALAGSQGDANWVFIAFAGPEPGVTEPGYVVPFDNRVLVFDSPGESEAENIAGLAHEIAHVFGAWHTGDENSLMHAPPGAHFDATALECLRLTRTMDMRTGFRALTPDTVQKYSTLWAAAKADPAANPIYQSQAAAGYELMSLGYVRRAVEPLSQALELAPAAPRPRYALAASYMVMRQYHSAADEFRRLAQSSPESAGTLNNLAAALLESGQAQEPVGALRKALEANPGSASLHANLGMALAGIRGELDQGIEELRTATRMDPNDNAAKAALDAALAARERGRR
jgi:Flp pilus assembly protein TadD